MKLLCHVVLFTFLFLSIFQLNECEASYCNEVTYIFHGNGMFTDHGDATINKNSFRLISVAPKDFRWVVLTCVSIK